MKPDYFIKQVHNTENIPIDLLHMADRSKDRINSYLKNGIIFKALNRESILGILIAYPVKI